MRPIFFAHEYINLLDLKFSDKVEKVVKKKMNLYAKKQKSILSPNSLRQIILVRLVAIFAVLLLLNLFYSQIKNSFYAAVYPIFRLFSQSGDLAYNFSDNFADSKSLLKANEDLRLENQNLFAQISFLQDALRQNEEIHQANISASASNFSLVLAKIIGLNWASDSIVINKGSDDGMHENMPLISKEKVVYGRITKVYENFSEVVLISANDSSFNVKIQSSDATATPVFGVIKGKGNLQTYLDLVNTDDQINEGDILATSGLDGLFPSNLLVGSVHSIDKSDAKPFQVAGINLFLKLGNIDNLFVITNYKK